MHAAPLSQDPRSPWPSTAIFARVLRHDRTYGLSTLQFADGELRVPAVDFEIGHGVSVEIDARDVAVALSRPMDISITNRLPGTILAVEPLALPYVRVTFDLGTTRLDALVTTESVERLGLEPGLRAWAMVKAVAIEKAAISPEGEVTPRPWPPAP
ncbi:molybdopterin-binding protein [Methyloraptor flagellatus]|jgi:molybdate transport system ATP-binding protein|uniref:TOBE domain-containing protein n=1 Tax=Methyloraptor flagellatus TaxID=3162530 RepID=A0AAU7XAP3_9HYPH